MSYMPRCAWANGSLFDLALLAPHDPHPLPPVEHERPALDLDEQQPVLPVQQHEVAFALDNGPRAVAPEPVEAVEDLDAVGQMFDQRTGDGAFAAVADVGGVQGGEEFGHGVPFGCGWVLVLGKWILVNDGAKCSKSVRNRQIWTLPMGGQVNDRACIDRVLRILG